MNNMQKSFKTKSKLRGCADGGMIHGPGTGTSDSVKDVDLSDGEFVMPADTVRAIGPEKLQAIVDATHTPVKGAKGLANGGFLGGGYLVNGALPLDDAADRARITGLRAAGTLPGQVGPPSPAFQPPAAAAAPPAAAPPPSAPPPATQAPRSLLQRAGGSLLRGGAAVGGLVGAGQAIADNFDGTRERSQQALGVETPLGSVVADTARTLARVGDAASFGLASRLGRGLAELAPGGRGFGAGFSGSESVAPAPEQRATAPTSGAGAPAAPTGAAEIAGLLSSQGVSPEDQALAPISRDARRSLLSPSAGRGPDGSGSSVGAGVVQPGQYLNLGDGIYGTALEPGGKIRSFTGGGLRNAGTVSVGSSANDPQSALAELKSLRPDRSAYVAQRTAEGVREQQLSKLNSKYDKLSENINRKFKGNFELRGIALQRELERDRVAELNDMSDTETARRGQDLTSESDRNQTAAQLRGQDFSLQSQREQNATSRQNNIEDNIIKIQKEAVDRAAAAGTASRASAEKGVSETIKTITDRFKDDPKLGDQVLTQVLVDPNFVGLPPDQRAAALEDRISAALGGIDADAQQSTLFGRTSGGDPDPGRGAPRPPRFSDLAKGRDVGTSLRENVLGPILPFYDPMVQDTDSGRVRSAPKTNREIRIAASEAKEAARRDEARRLAREQGR